MDKIDAMQELTRMIGQYQNLIFSICVRMTNDYFIAEDLTQETFLSAFQKQSVAALSVCRIRDICF